VANFSFKFQRQQHHFQEGCRRGTGLEGSHIHIDQTRMERHWDRLMGKISYAILFGHHEICYHSTDNIKAQKPQLLKHAFSIPGEDQERKTKRTRQAPLTPPRNQGFISVNEEKKVSFPPQQVIDISSMGRERERER
jgi:hypothetical protein